MAKREEIRFRVQRYLNGPFNPSDLSVLFLFLRGCSLGRQSVRDLGNMIGHADIRDSGLSVDRVRYMQTIARYKLQPFVNKSSASLDLSDAPPTLLPVMDATFNLLDDETLLNETGLTRNQIGTALTRIKRKFSLNNHGNLFWDSYPVTAKEIAVIKCLTNFLISKGAYSAEELWRDTLYLLLRYGFMDEEQSELFRSKRDYLSLFAIATIHGVLFDCPDGVPAEAEAGWTTVEDKTYLNVSVKFLIHDEPEIKISLALFDTDLHPSEWVEDYAEGKRNVSFDCPIEITEGGKLRCMI